MGGRTEVTPELVAAGFVGHWPDRTVEGPAALSELITRTHSMLTPLSFAIEEGPFTDGDLVAGHWRGRDQQDGVPVEFVGNDILRRRDGTFVEYWVAWAPVP